MKTTLNTVTRPNLTQEEQERLTQFVWRCRLTDQGFEESEWKHIVFLRCLADRGRLPHG